MLCSALSPWTFPLTVKHLQTSPCPVPVGRWTAAQSDVSLCLNRYRLPAKAAPSVSNWKEGTAKLLWARLAGISVGGQQVGWVCVLFAQPCPCWHCCCPCALRAPWAVCLCSLGLVQGHFSGSGSSVCPHLCCFPVPFLPLALAVCSGLSKAFPQSCCLRLPRALQSLPFIFLGHFQPPEVVYNSSVLITFFFSSCFLFLLSFYTHPPFPVDL